MLRVPSAGNQRTTEGCLLFSQSANHLAPSSPPRCSTGYSTTDSTLLADPSPGWKWKCSTSPAMRDSKPACLLPAAKRAAGTVNETVRVAAGSGAVAGDFAADAVTPSSAGAAAEPGGSRTSSDERRMMPSGE